MPLLVKRSVTLSGHDTSLALEPEFWAVLDAMAKSEGLSLARLVRRIDEDRGERPLASACRVAALAFAGQTTGAAIAARVNAPTPESLGAGSTVNAAFVETPLGRVSSD